MEKSIERKQMKQISEFESKVSLIQQRNILRILHLKRKKIIIININSTKEIERLGRGETGCINS